MLLSQGEGADDGSQVNLLSLSSSVLINFLLLFELNGQHMLTDSRTSAWFVELNIVIKILKTGFKKKRKSFAFYMLDYKPPFILPGSHSDANVMLIVPLFTNKPVQSQDTYMWSDGVL